MGVSSPQRVMSHISNNGIFSTAKTALSVSRRKAHPYLRHIYTIQTGHSHASKYKILTVDPNNITHETESLMGGLLDQRNAVVAGRWDHQLREFSDRVKVTSLRKHFEKSVSWEETKYFKRKLGKIQNGGEWRGCNSEAELLGFFQSLDRLYDDIEKNGYQLQSSLVENAPAETRQRNNDAPEVELNEIGVNITRNGELVWHSAGQHRLAIAQLLELDEIPVQVIARHRKWETVRKRILKADSRENLSSSDRKLLSHPDLRDVDPDLY